MAQSLTCSFLNTWKASNYPVITPFIASLRLTTFWQAFPVRFSSQHRFLSTRKGAAGLLSLLLPVLHGASCTPHPHSSQPWALLQPPPLQALMTGWVGGSPLRYSLAFNIHPSHVSSLCHHGEGPTRRLLTTWLLPGTFLIPRLARILWPQVCV